ncbi:hypothetical protein MalM25_24980 [Planctomycetes bacterium MalM25]|nr:hypothetical protein MalM25_24980 [Planctomycetes bacterium MalM25]
MSSILARVDDKHVPLYRVLWTSATPHFCGEEDCLREGSYEVRLEEDETLWASPGEHEDLLKQLESWRGGLGSSGDSDW